MSFKKLLSASAVFFCTIGWVCGASALGGPSGEGRGYNPGSAVPVRAFDQPAQNASDDQPAVSVSPFGQIDLHVKDVDLSKVLQLLSIQAQRNIVASRNVSGRVTADLYGVEFYEALDAILHPNGFGYQEKGNFIYVYTQQELQAIQDAEREMITRVVRLNYLTAGDASTFASPLLSPAGSIAISGAVSAGYEASSGDGGADSYAQAPTLVIRDFPENVEAIMEVVTDLDVRPKQVMIEATILEASLTEMNALGVDLSVIADFSFADLSNPLSGVGDLLSGAVGGGSAGSTSVGNSNNATAGVKVGIVHDDFAVFVQALDQVTDTTVIANPKLLVLNRQRAKLVVGGREGYISTTATDTSETQTVEFLDEGTQLAVRPFVGEDDFIRLEIQPSISDATVREVAGFVVPNETTQELTTNVMVRNGQTVVLGGLFKETTTVTRKQVPFLGDVPILGVAFRGQDDSVTRNEYIFMLTPTIVKDEALYAIGEEGKSATELARLGARESLLPWSRSKLHASYLREAMEAAEAGDTDKALWAVDNALALDKTSFEARRMKEKLTGERAYWPKRSILNDAADEIIRGEVNRLPEIKKKTSVAPKAKQAAPGVIETTAWEGEGPQAIEQPVVKAQEPVEAQQAEAVSQEASDVQVVTETVVEQVSEPAGEDEAGQPVAESALSEDVESAVWEGSEEEASRVSPLQWWEDDAGKVESGQQAEASESVETPVAEEGGNEQWQASEASTEKASVNILKAINAWAVPADGDVSTEEQAQPQQSEADDQPQAVEGGVEWVE